MDVNHSSPAIDWFDHDPLRWTTVWGKGETRYFVEDERGRSERSYAEGQVATAIASGILRTTSRVCVVGTETWLPLGTVPAFAAALNTRVAHQRHSSSEPSDDSDAVVLLTKPKSSSTKKRTCTACLEEGTADGPECPLCGEPFALRTAVRSTPSGATRSGPGAPTGTPVGSMMLLRRQPGRGVARWVIGAALLGTAAAAVVIAIASRGREGTAHVPAPTAASARQAGATSARGSERGHLDGLAIRGAVPVGEQARAVLLIGTRVVVATKAGVEVRELANGQLVSLVSDAPGTDTLTAVGGVVYASGGRSIYVIDVDSARLMRRIDLRTRVGRPASNRAGTRVLVPLATERAVAIIATEYHAEVQRMRFDDEIASVEWSPDDKRALALTGRMSSTRGYYGYRSAPKPVGTTVYAFDPWRMDSQQDHVRVSAGKHPWSVGFVGPDRAVIALRAENSLLELTWDANGVPARGAQQSSCTDPAQVVIGASGRIVVRCPDAKAISILDPDAPPRQIDLPGTPFHLLLSPDALEAYVSFKNDESGGVASVNLTNGNVRSLDLGALPMGIALSPDGTRLYALGAQARRLDVIE